MDPISALSIACNIVQLIDFGCEVVSETRKLYHAAGGASEDTLTLKAVTSDLTDLTKTLRSSLRTASNGALLSADAQRLEKLGAGCADTADELQELLKTLTLQGHATRWKALQATFRGVRSKGRKEDIMKRLQNYREEFNLRVVIGLRYV